MKSHIKDVTPAPPMPLVKQKTFAFAAMLVSVLTPSANGHTLGTVQARSMEEAREKAREMHLAEGKSCTSLLVMEVPCMACISAAVLTTTPGA